MAHRTATRGVVIVSATVVALLGLGGPACWAQEVGAVEPGGVEPFRGDIEPILMEYCFDCHGDGLKRGGVALDELLAKDAGEGIAEWRKTWKIVRHEFMPPAGKPLPSESERRAITQWIEQRALGVDYSKPDPGRVTIRRLNRVEYEYTVLDLFGVTKGEEESLGDRSLAAMGIRDRLPPDDTAYGFDNIGDFQTLSPALLEKYLNLAGEIADRVIVQDGPRYPELSLGHRVAVSRSADTNRTEHVVEFDLEHEGQYRVDVEFRLGGWQEFGGTYTVVIGLDEQALAADRVDVGGNTTQKYASDVRLGAGRHRLVLATDAVEPDIKGKLNHLQVRPEVTVTGPIGAGIYEYPQTHQRVFFDGPAPEGAEARRGYAREIVRRVADRAFRRPVDEATLDRLVEIVMEEPVFEVGVGQALMAILVSPRFLFRAETQPSPDDPKTVHELDEYALASRLSYLLWLSIPDEELTGLASRGELRSNLNEQVERMLADERSSRFFEDFAGQWLRTRNVLMTAISRADDLDPVREAMKRETEMLFEHLARGDRDMIELVTADYTFINKPLAEYYGIEGFEGEGFARFDLPEGGERGGILTHGSFLVSTSNPNRTSPVKRGLFILENLLGTQPPPPPANVPPLEEPAPTFGRSRGEPQKSIVEQLAAHRADPSCAACHAHFDPFGIVLERYDLKGKWRSDETAATEETTVTGEKLTGIGDLRELIGSRKDKFYRCMAEKLMTYALGRGLEPYDAMTIDGITDRMMADGGRFSTLLVAVVESPAFQLRRGDDGQVREAEGVAIPETPPPDKRRPQRRQRPPREQPAEAERAVEQAAEQAAEPAAAQTEQAAAPANPAARVEEPVEQEIER